MRVRKRWSLLLLLSLLLSLVVTPAQAALIPVDPAQPPILTSRADAQKIAQLQTYAHYLPLSPISPDEQSLLLVAVAGGQIQFAFLNITNGAVTPVKFPSRFLVPALNPFWADNQTLVYVAVQGQQPVLVTLNRQTGEAKVDKVQLPGFPINFSPDGSKLLFAVPTEALNPKADGLNQTLDPLKSPFDQKMRVLPEGAQTNRFWQGLLSDEEQADAKLFAKSDEFMSYASFPVSVLAYDFKTNKIIPVLNLAPKTVLAYVGWSPDSSRVAIYRYFEIGDIGQYSGGQRLNDLVVQDALGQLPPENNPLFQGAVIGTYDFTSNTARPDLIKASANNGTDTFGSLDWSPDNQTLVVQTTRPSRLQGRRYPVYLLPESSYFRFYNTDGQIVGTLDRDEINAAPANLAISIPYFVAPDEVLINATRGTNNRIYYYNRSSGEFRELPTPAGVTGGFNLYSSSILPTRQSRQIVFTHSSFTSAPEVYRIGWDGSGLTPLTNLNAQVTAAGKVRADAVNFTLANGQQRSGYLLQAANAEFPPKNVPIIVWQEGGPINAFLNQWAANVENPFNLLPNFGFAVLFVPLSGRSGFGPAFYKGLYDNDNYGRIDIDEMAEIVQQTISRGYTSPGKIGITGCSYGGYFTSQSIVRYPDLYAAANSQCTLADLFTEVQFDQTAAFFAIVGRSPTADPDFYVRASPLFNSTKVKTPTLFFHGVNDFIPIKTIVNFHDQIQANGVAVNLMAFNQEGHGLGLPTNQLIAAQAQINWFRQYLGGGTAAPASVNN